MDRVRLLAFLQSHLLAVQTSVTPDGAPQAAVVGIAVSDRLEVVFDTVGPSRKAQNLRADPRIALVIGGLDGYEEQTVQLEGVADEPTGAELARLRAVYFAAHPDGVERASWPGLTYFRVRPTWLRYSDYDADPPQVVELDEAAIARAAGAPR